MECIEYFVLCELFPFPPPPSLLASGSPVSVILGVYTISTFCVSAFSLYHSPKKVKVSCFLLELRFSRIVSTYVYLHLHVFC